MAKSGSRGGSGEDNVELQFGSLEEELKYGFFGVTDSALQGFFLQLKKNLLVVFMVEQARDFSRAQNAAHVFKK